MVTEVADLPSPDHRIAVTVENVTVSDVQVKFVRLFRYIEGNCGIGASDLVRLKDASTYLAHVYRRVLQAQEYREAFAWKLAIEGIEHIQLQVLPAMRGDCMEVRKRVKKKHVAKHWYLAARSIYEIERVCKILKFRCKEERRKANLRHDAQRRDVRPTYPFIPPVAPKSSEADVDGGSQAQALQPGP